MSLALRSSRPALLFATALLLSSCGIPETGVVETGEPATGIRPAQLLYFVSEGAVVAVHRQVVIGPVGVETAVEAVLEGPDVTERRRGMTTELPRLTGDATVGTDGGRVTVELPVGTRHLTETALTQLICTAAGAGPDKTSTKVTVTVPDAWRTEGSSETCASATGAAMARLLD
ncbi:hypothetical protein OG742_43825 [Streptomyces sp. NBC_00828]|uniref:hypothetical protein n=1 Tax=Streptomyces sp. NBC_00828 TaxID=2903678 RepID=UPI00386C398D